MYASLYSHLIISLWKSIHLPSVVAFHGQSPKVKKLKWVGFDSTNLSIWSKQPSILTLSRDTMELLMVKMIICVLIFLGKQTCLFFIPNRVASSFFPEETQGQYPLKKTYLCYIHASLLIFSFDWCIKLELSVSVYVAPYLEDHPI